MHLLSLICRPVKDSFLVHKMTLLKNFRRLATDDAQTLTLQSNMEPKFISISEESLIFLIFFFLYSFLPTNFPSPPLPLKVHKKSKSLNERYKD